MDLTLQLVIEWDEFPESFQEDWMHEILRSEGCDGGVVIELHAEYTPGCPGRFDGHPDNMYPAEAPEVEICGSVIMVRRDLSISTEPFHPRFLEICHQYAADWLELNEEQVIEKLLAKGHDTHQDEIAEILAEIELDIDRRRDRQKEDEQFADYAAATWAATRTNAPDEG